MTYLLKTPPNSDAFKHSGGESLLWTSATVTLYLEVELSNDNRPGTEQKTSPGIIPRWCIWPSFDVIPCAWAWWTDPTWEWWWGWTIPAAWWAWWATDAWSRERIPRNSHIYFYKAKHFYDILLMPCLIIIFFIMIKLLFLISYQTPF